MTAVSPEICPVMPMQSPILSMNGSPLLSIGDLTVTYLARKGEPTTPALRKVDLDVWPGEIVGFWANLVPARARLLLRF